MNPAADVDDAGRSTLPLAFQLGQEAECLLRRDVTPVGNRVHRDIGHPDRRCQSHQAAQMVDVAMHASIGNQTNDVERARQTLNIAKAILFAIMEGELVGTVERK